MVITWSLAIGSITAIVSALILAQAFAMAGFPLPPADRRVGHIDGLRGIIAVAVLVHHFVIWVRVLRGDGQWADPDNNLYAQLGNGAVGLFFMISGLVFYPRVLAGFRTTNWRGLLVNRVFRIEPLVIASTLAITAIIVARAGVHEIGAYPKAFVEWITAWNERPLLGYRDSDSMNAHVLWSLRYEWLFYLLILPACAMARDAIGSRLPTIVVPALLFAVGVIGELICPGWRAFSLTSLLAVGMLAYECQQREWLAALFRGPIASVVALAILAIGIAIAPDPFRKALPFFAFFFVCIACGNSLWGILTWPGSLVLGEISYSIYLLHGIILSIIFVDLRGDLTSIPTQSLYFILPAAAIATTLLAAATFRLIEAPCIIVGRRLAKRLSKTNAPPPRPIELEVAP